MKKVCLLIALSCFLLLNACGTSELPPDNNERNDLSLADLQAQAATTEEMPDGYEDVFATYNDIIMSDFDTSKGYVYCGYEAIGNTIWYYFKYDGAKDRYTSEADISDLENYLNSFCGANYDLFKKNLAFNFCTVLLDDQDENNVLFASKNGITVYSAKQ